MFSKILICDDYASDASILEGFLKDYSGEHPASFEITVCNTEEDILRELDRSHLYNIIFLDIYLGSLNGMELAAKIREKNTVSSIVIVSVSQEHALEAFSVNAIQYMVKPVTYEAVCRVMNQLMDLQNVRSRCISIFSKGRTVTLDLKKVVYAETQGHYQIITLCDGTTEKVRMSSVRFFETVSFVPGFFRLGVSFIINMDYVFSFTATVLTLAGDYRIRIPRGAHAALKENYFNYFCNGSRGGNL